MRGRTVPILNSASLQNTASYVQINIYDTNLKALRKRGVDVKHFLQHVGCRSVVMDVPIVSSEVRKPTRLAGRRLNKSFGGFTVHAEDFLLDEVQQSSENVDSRRDQHDCHDMSLDLDNDQKLNEVNTTKVAFCESMVDEVVKGPLTSTPMLAKSADSFRSFLSARGTVDDAFIDGVYNESDSELLNSERYVQQPSDRTIVESAAAVSSFAATGMKDVKFANGDGTLFAGAASFCAEFHESEDKEVERSIRSKTLVDVLADSGTSPATKASSHVGATPAVSAERHTSNATKSSSSAAVRDTEGSATAHPPSVCPVEDLDEPRTVPSRNPSSNNRKRNRRKRMRPASSQEDLCNENKGSHEVVEGSTDEDEDSANQDMQEKCVTSGAPAKADQSFTCQFPECKATLVWRPRYGKNRLVDHVRVHWGKEVKQCKICGFKTTSFRNVRHHHKMLHPNVSYQGSLSIETKEDIKELLELWKKCFPDDTWNIGGLLNKLQDREWFLL
ncbi:hypothetical protein Y032_0050g1988 [Ancylostoma ceylanicum]|uniref:C2H2-type domain-containing protein n=1 Tax=Ancylostoma ceylanicum TaxID=53326 RepID=A0A016U8G7_9BILA|nr:hypothetical protein Y032_0050g1988 [Ancylostoma ceylanicum]